MKNAYVARFSITVKDDLMNFFSDCFPSSITTFVHTSIVLMLYAAAQKTVYYGIFPWPLMVWYLIITQVISAAGMNIIREVNDDVQNGKIATLLAKPFSYPVALYTTYIGSTITETLGTLLLVIPLGLFVAGIAPQAYAIVLGILLVFFAITIGFLISLCIGLIAFWTEDATPYSWIYSKIIFVLGGIFFPLEVFPSTIQSVAKILPTAFIIYYPAKLMVLFDLHEYLYVLGMQIMYICVLLLIAAAIYRKAVKRVSINGG